MLATHSLLVSCVTNAIRHGHSLIHRGTCGCTTQRRHRRRRAGTLLCHRAMYGRSNPARHSFRPFTTIPKRKKHSSISFLQLLARQHPSPPTWASHARHSILIIFGMSLAMTRELMGMAAMLSFSIRMEPEIGNCYQSHDASQ